MVWILLKKDLLRAKKTPMVYLIQLALPVMITALIGMAFAPRAGKVAFPKIKIAVVDEDQEFISNFIRGSFGGGPTQSYLDVQLLEWNEAITRLEANQLSAVIKIPQKFTIEYLENRVPPPLELIKNPAERYLPKFVEEGMLILTEVLNIVGRNFGQECQQLSELLKQNKWPKTGEISAFVEKISDKLSASEKYLFPLLIEFKIEQEKADENKNSFNFFMVLLPGISALFLLFIAEMAMRDLLKEQQEKTLSRLLTLRPQLYAVILAKMSFGSLLMVISSLILFAGGSLLFKISWKSPLFLGLILVSYAFVGTGIVAFLTALAKSENQANVLNSMFIMMLGFLGGSMIPASQLPRFLQENVSIYFPNYWFIETVLAFQKEGTLWSEWLIVPLSFVGTGVLLMLISSILLQKRLNQGVR